MLRHVYPTAKNDPQDAENNQLDTQPAYRFARHVSDQTPSWLMSAFKAATPAPARRNRIRLRSTKTSANAHAPAQTHRLHRRHHSTMRVRASSRGPLCTCRIIWGLEADAIAGYPKNGFWDDMGGSTIVEGTRWKFESGTEAEAAGGLGWSNRGKDGGRWCDWNGDRRASSR